MHGLWDAGKEELKLKTVEVCYKEKLEWDRELKSLRGERELFL